MSTKNNLGQTDGIGGAGFRAGSDGRRIGEGPLIDAIISKAAIAQVAERKGSLNPKSSMVLRKPRKGLRWSALTASAREIIAP